MAKIKAEPKLLTTERAKASQWVYSSATINHILAGAESFLEGFGAFKVSLFVVMGVHVAGDRKNMKVLANVKR